MSSPEASPNSSGPPTVELPRSTVWPLVLSFGVTLLLFGLATSLAFSVVGLVAFLIGAGGWISQLLPGRGHYHEQVSAQPAVPVAGASLPVPVETLRPGMAGYRFQLPKEVHPISAGFKGGLLGGLVMPLPALAYGLLSGHGLWFPVNLLAGMILPGLGDESVQSLGQFHLSWLIVAIIIHAVISAVLGLLYGVLMPTAPSIPGGPMVFGGLVLPLLWTWASYGLMGLINPLLRQHVDWLWFVLSQLVFGLTAALVVQRSEKVPVSPRKGIEAPPAPEPTPSNSAEGQSQ